MNLATLWEFVAFALLQPPLGALVLILIYRMTGGQWFAGLKPHLIRFSRLVPFAWLLLAPLLWRYGGKPASDASLALYFGFTGRLIRYVATGVVLTLIAWLSRRGLDAPLPPADDATAGFASRPAPRWIGPAGFIVMVFTLHLAAVDWLVTGQPKWYSTGFPLIWMAGNTLSALALALFLTLRAGHSPAAPGASGRPEGIDWGNLLMACVLFWSYVSFTHFLIMWMGNLSHEIAWYQKRTPLGWKLLIDAIALFHLGVPLLLLFFRSFKQNRRALGSLAAALVVLQAAHTAWLILP